MSNNVRHIDANELRKRAKPRKCINSKGEVVVIKCITLEDIDDAPTLEVKPVADTKPKVVFGKWVQRGFEMYCNHCWTEAPKVYRGKYTVSYDYPNRCPHCNAMMEGVYY